MSLEKFNPVMPAQEDGFSAEEAGSWILLKNKIIHNYLQVFTGTMKRKFNYLVYIDLFSGSGLKKISESQYTYGSPIIALDDSMGFSKHIFCDQDPTRSEALKVRVNKYYRSKNVVVFNGDPDNIIDRLVYYIPESTRKHKVATLCLIDPLSLDIEFETVKMLSDLGVNFLYILSLPWKNEMNYKKCIHDERELLNAFLGIPWSQVNSKNTIRNDITFFRLLVKSYHQKLSSLGYMSSGSLYKIEESDLNVPYFFAGYYFNTRETRKIYSEVLRKVNSQVNLFE